MLSSYKDETRVKLKYYHKIKNNSKKMSDFSCWSVGKNEYV